MSVGQLGRRAIFGGLAIIGAAFAAAPVLAEAKAPKTVAQLPEEKAAVGVIKAWTDALVAKDLDKAMAYIDDGIQYRDDPFQIELKKGRTLLIDDLKILLRGLTAVTYEEIYTVGSAKNDVLVLARRVDTFKLGEKMVDQKMGGYFRVRNGKILEWLDTPMVAMPPAPAGAAPLGAAPAGPPHQH